MALEMTQKFDDLETFDAAGVDLKMDPAWHTYWKNPGDSGYPPSFKWEGSEGFLNPQVSWPAPAKFILPGHITEYGYEGEVVYPVQAQLDPTGQSVHVSAAISYLTCNTACVPYKYTFSLDLPVGKLESDPEPAALIDRQPFPGPGLAVRILGEVTKDKCDILREADAIYIAELKARGLYDKIWQAFSVLLPVRSVGVAGDERKYGSVLALRAVVSEDGMTADVYPFEMKDILEISSAITNKVSGIGRVVYDISSKPPATIEWE